MFDTIGRDLDQEEGNRRRAQSVLLSALLLGAGVGFTVGLGMYTAAGLVVEDDPLDEPVVMIDLSDPRIDEAPPALPAAPPPPAKGVAQPESVEPQAAPDPAVPAPLTPPKPLVDSHPPVGTPDGVDHGEPDGKVSGRPGGKAGGTGDGTGGGGPRVFHHRELQLRASPPGTYPREAKALNLGEVTCYAKVLIDDRGKPFEVEVERCPLAFHGAARKTLLKWRWYAPRDENRARVSAQTVVRVTFRLDDAP